mgnify:CR=1 FL=1
MKNPQARKNRREKIIEISMCLLSASDEGLRVSYVQKIIEESCRFRCSRNTLGQVMALKVRSGEVEHQLTKEGHSFWKLNPVYIPPLETE